MFRPVDLQEFVGANLSDVGEAFARALGIPIRLEVSPGSEQELGLVVHQPGVRLRIKSASSQLIFFLPEGPYLPEGYLDPSPTWRARWGTLAQELALILFPEDLDAEGAFDLVERLGQGLEEGLAGGGGRVLRLRLVDPKDQSPGAIWVLSVGQQAAGAWHESSGPLSQELPSSDDSWKEEPAVTPSAAESPQTAGESSGKVPGAVVQWDSPQAGPEPPRPRSTKDLPPFVRGLLRVPLAVSVTLARRRQPVRNILQLSPGAIIQFEKSCDELLDLEVSGRVIAQGEAVKVGEKFGLRILRMVPPPERLVSLRPRRPE
jgi:flagellar motor switch protein FliN